MLGPNSARDASVRNIADNRLARLVAVGEKMDVPLAGAGAYGRADAFQIAVKTLLSPAQVEHGERLPLSLGVSRDGDRNGAVEIRQSAKIRASLHRKYRANVTPPGSAAPFMETGGKGAVGKAAERRVCAEAPIAGCRRRVQNRRRAIDGAFP